MHGYQVAPEVVHEVIDGEVVIIHLGTGVYYSVQRAGVAMWEGAAAGATAERIAQVARAEADGFLAELEREGLIVRTGEGDEAWQPTDGAPDGGAPRLERFTDMEDLLLLDPVHEVDSGGWPHAAP